MYEAEAILLPLQKLQQQHDELAHRDILSFDLYKRLKHMVLHFYKYAGKIELAREAGDAEAFRQVLLDVFIICMASANALNVSLGEKIKTKAEFKSLDSLAHSLSVRIDKADLFATALRHLVVVGGRMAKAIESADHMEDGNPRADMSMLVPQLTENVLGVLGCVRGGLEVEVRTRLANVEQKSILNRFSLLA